MSDADVSGNATFISDKAILTDFLKLYKSFPCLWNQKHVLYSNKETRQKAYEVLLQKYELYQDDATVADVKKKLEYMRCAYRREYKKVISARLSKGEVYTPCLWYYNLLTFLNTSYHDVNGQLHETHEIEDSEDDEEPETKKVKMDSTNAIYLQEQQSDEVSIVFEQDPDFNSDLIQTETESFGRTVGHQLKGLTHMQRIYAEKLISDVIFQARLGNLTAEATIDLK